MLTPNDFVMMSLDLNLFFLRIMKEHALFLELGFTPRDSRTAEEAAHLRMVFEKLLDEAAELADGYASERAIESQQFVTEYTMEAERLTKFYTGVMIDPLITKKEAAIGPGNRGAPPRDLVRAVEALDRKAYRATSMLADFKSRLLTSVRSCEMFTLNYPLLIEHILREARFFMTMLVMLVKGEDIMDPRDLINKEAFWNRIMAEHSKFIAGLLDPSEQNLIDTARMFGKTFDKLTAEAVEATNQTLEAAKVTDESIAETIRLRDFKSAGTDGILNCQIQSIILPLLGDHVLREANHYLYVLGMSK